ncbi:MAG TPA: glycoside hydrolase family 3 N-terminal domain-containing protein, partial [Chitinophagales bacterium]|nr:glycoside hydrolase family 3 N-terminal domain-containing protein [Chitinophagales bacterium]
MIRYLGILILTVGMANPSSHTVIPGNDSPPFVPFYERNYHWVDSLMETMSVEEKIGQLFMVAAYSNKDAAHEQAISKLIRDYKIGGLIFMQGGPVRQARLTNTYQSIASIPLLIAMDAEWGPAMRLDSVASFQRQLTW